MSNTTLRKNQKNQLNNTGINQQKLRPCKPDCVKSSLKIRHNPLIYPHAGL